MDERLQNHCETASDMQSCVTAGMRVPADENAHLKTGTRLAGFASPRPNLVPHFFSLPIRSTDLTLLPKIFVETLKDRYFTC
jgi:hypothetical protein